MKIIIQPLVKEGREEKPKILISNPVLEQNERKLKILISRNDTQTTQKKKMKQTLIFRYVLMRRIYSWNTERQPVRTTNLSRRTDERVRN